MSLNVSIENFTGARHSLWLRVRRALRRRSCDAISWLAFQTLGRVLNGWNSPVLLSYRPDSHYDFRQFPEYAKLYRAWIFGNRRNNAGDLTRFYMLMLNCQKTLRDGVLGDFVELGVYKGNSAATLAHFARADGRQTFLFDTFSGFDSRDMKGLDSRTHMAFADTSLQSVQKLVGTGNVTYVQGFFPESCEGIDLPERIAIAHIDCDLHDPMKAALERFYPLMSPGGLMIMHDYSSGHWIGATKAIDQFFADKPEKPILIPDKSGSAIVKIRSF